MPCSVYALLQGYIYVEADREAHVKEAVSGLRAVFQSKPARLVPLREMVDALTTSKKGDPLLSAYLTHISQRLLSCIQSCCPLYLHNCL